MSGDPGPVVDRSGARNWLSGLARSAPTTNKARTQRVVRADVSDGDVYLDLAALSGLATAPLGGGDA